MNAQMKPMDNGLSPLRVGRITGSRCAAVLGLNPYSKRDDVLREMVREHFGTEREFTGNEATRHGQAKEPEALAKYEAERGVMTYGGGELILHPTFDFLAITPDGLVGDHGMVECKAPYYGNYTHYEAVPYYVPQLHLQMQCADREWCDFVVLQRDGALHVSRLHRDDAWMHAALPVLESFMADYLSALESPDRFLGDRERTDAKWAEASRRYLQTCAEIGVLEAAQKIQREVLLALAGDASAKGAGVQVIRSERAGSVAYAKALKDLAPDADLTPYTGKSTVVFTVKEMKA